MRKYQVRFGGGLWKSVRKDNSPHSYPTASTGESLCPRANHARSFDLVSFSLQVLKQVSRISTFTSRFCPNYCDDAQFVVYFTI